MIKIALFLFNIIYMQFKFYFLMDFEFISLSLSFV
jgi:hypothetical protein